MYFGYVMILMYKNPETFFQKVEEDKDMRNNSNEISTGASSSSKNRIHMIRMMKATMTFTWMMIMPGQILV